MCVCVSFLPLFTGIQDRRVIFLITVQSEDKRPECDAPPPTPPSPPVAKDGCDKRRSFGGEVWSAIVRRIVRNGGILAGGPKRCVWTRIILPLLAGTVRSHRIRDSTDDDREWNDLIIESGGVVGRRQRSIYPTPPPQKKSQTITPPMPRLVVELQIQQESAAAEELPLDARVLMRLFEQSRSGERVVHKMRRLMRVMLPANSRSVPHSDNQ